MWKKNICFVLVIFAYNGFTTYSQLFPKEQQNMIDQVKEYLKEDVKEKRILENYFLGRWLDSTNFNVQLAVQQIREYVEWRNKYNISTILNEDWSDMRALFPYSHNTFDKLGRPVMYINGDKWDVYGYLTSDSADVNRFVRYTHLFMEDTMNHVRQLQSEGRNVSQHMELVNAAGFGLQKHACLSCLSLYRNIMKARIPHETVFTTKTIIINVPYIFKAVHSIITEEDATVYGQDRKQWEAGLLQYLDRDQIPQDIFNELPDKDNNEGLFNWKSEL